jgi:CheY-like chemotaxis protein
MTKPRWQEQARAQGVDIEVKKGLAEVDAIAGSEAELHEMLTNLIFNAVDAMPDGGALTFRTRQNGDKVVLEVGDTGIGMSEDVRRHCLDPFFATKQESGTGLGLSTVRGSVKRHGGEITVESEEGEGTTFRIAFPRGVEEEEEESERTGRGPGSLKILVVDDEEEQRELLKEYLCGDGHRVQVAPDGREALRKFMGGYYDLVITDRSMPEISGDRLAAQIKAEAPEKPVIMLTGFGDMMDAAGEEIEGIDSVLSKPVSLDELRDAITEVDAGQDSD